MIYNSKNTLDSEKIGYMLANKLDEVGKKSAFIAMRGEMGVGKTAFVRGFASYFDITGVKSPTYSIVNEHKSEKTAIFHFDMYRVESEDDLLSIAYYDYLARQGFSIVEWSENIEEFIPEDAICVTILRVKDSPDFRTIEISEDI